MADFATPNLPSRDFLKTERFYSRLGFVCSHRSGHWMILKRGGVWLEFFPWPDLDPGKDAQACCVRLDDLYAVVRQVREAGIEEARTGHPRLMPPQRDVSGLTIAYLNDIDNNLLRLVQNPDKG